MNPENELIYFLDVIKPHIAGKIQYSKLHFFPNHFFVQFGLNYERHFNFIWSDKRNEWEIILDFKAYVFGDRSNVLHTKRLYDLSDALSKEFMKGLLIQT